MKLREAMLLNAILALEELRAAIGRAGPSEEQCGVQEECLRAEAAIARRLAFKLERQAHHRAASVASPEFKVGDRVKQVSADDAMFPDGTILTVVDPGDRFSMCVLTPTGDVCSVRPAAYERLT